MARPLSPVLVGRTEELGCVRQALAEPGSVIAILGDAGIGKSRLSREASALFAADGNLVLTGYCLDRGQTALAPITTAIRQHTRLLDDKGLGELFSGPARLASRLFPELAGKHSQCLPVAPVRTKDVAAAVSCVLRRLAEERPVLIVIEDVHWAGPDTADLIVALAQRSRDVPFSLIVTARAESVDHDQPFAALTALRALPGMTEITLRPLTTSEAREMVFTLSAAAIDGELAATIVQRSQGVPLFVEELCEAARSERSSASAVSLSTDTAHLPGTISDAILARLRALDADTMRILRLAAVAGEQIDRRLTAVAAGASVEQVDHALRLAYGHRVVSEVEDADSINWKFRHALTRETLLGELRGADRRRAHVQAAEALRSRFRRDLGPVAVQISQHYVAADEPADALTFALEAARHAARQGAPAETKTQFQLALRLASETGADPLPTLIEAADACFYVVGDDQTTEFAREARRLANGRRDRVAEAKALTYMARVAYRTAGRLEESIALSEEALALCTGLDDHAEAEVIEHLVTWKHGTARDAPPALVARGLELARGSGNRRALAGLEIVSALSATSADEADAAFSLAVAAAVACGDALAESLALGNGAYAMMERGRLRRARELAFEALRASDLVPDLRPWVLALLGWISALRGELVDALRWADEVPDVTDAITRSLVNRTRVEVALRRGDMAEARRAAFAVDPSERAPSEHQVALRVEVTLDPSVAPPAARAMIAGQWPPGPFKGNPAPAPWAVVPVARALLHAEEYPLVRELADTVLSQVRGGDDPGSRAAADLLRGLAAMADHEYVNAAKVLHRAVDASADAPMPARQVEAMLELADAQSAAGQGAKATATLADAHRIASDIGAWALVDEVAAAARTRGIRIATRPRDRAGLGELSDRETDVARLVAEGCSNAEIAGRLFLSPRTAANHVSNILSKLGIRRRSEIARWAVENGLVGMTAGAGDSTVRSRSRLTIVDG